MHFYFSVKVSHASLNVVKHRMMILESGVYLGAVMSYNLTCSMVIQLSQFFRKKILQYLNKCVSHAFEYRGSRASSERKRLWWKHNSENQMKSSGNLLPLKPPHPHGSPAKRKIYLLPIPLRAHGVSLHSWHTNDWRPRYELYERNPSPSHKPPLPHNETDWVIIIITLPELLPLKEKAQVFCLCLAEICCQWLPVYSMSLYFYFSSAHNWEPRHLFIITAVPHTGDFALVNPHTKGSLPSPMQNWSM